MKLAHERIGDHAATSPDADALLFEGERWSFGQLWQSASHDGRCMVSAGVTSGTRVGLAIPRSPDLVSLVVGSLMSGAAYVPLDPKLPFERLAYMASDSGVSFVITATEERPEWLAPEIPSSSLAALRVNGNRDTVLSGPALAGPAPDDLAYVIYTSGSTGRPKGARNAHRNLALVLSAWDSVVKNVDANSTFLFHSTLSFDASLTEFLWPLAAGLRVAIMPDDVVAGFGESFGARMDRHGVTHLQCTPTRAVLLLADPEDRRSLRSVRQMLIGGEALPPALVHQLSGAGVRLVTNIYGPTECSIWSFAFDVTSTLGASVPIGFPLQGAEAVIVDDELMPVLDGVEGQLLIVGPFVGLGYHGQPELTAEKFSTRMINGQQRRVYLTGDRARVREGGVFEFLGRIDTQVKLRGQRIELGEIEAVLIEQKSVAQAVAQVVSHGLGDDRLVAYVIASEGSFDEAAVRASLNTRLPPVMRPTLYVEVESFALTPSGKVDRRALPEPPPQALAQLEATSAVSPLDEIVHDFGVVLGRPVGPDEDFFALGGHSLLAVQLLARIGDRRDLALPLTVLLDAPTPRLLAERAANPGGFSESSSLVHYGPAVASTRLYLVHGAGGNVIGFREMADLLRDDVEVIGIQAAGVEPGRIPDTTMGEMVTRYATAIRAYDPVGPYFLGGYSDGGVIAMHLAQELRSQGASISGLVILDSCVVEPLPSTSLGKVGNILRNAKDRGGRPLTTWVRASARAWKSRALYVDANAAAAEKLGYVGVDLVVDRAVANAGSPGRVPANALLFRCAESNPVFWLDYSLVLRSPAQTETVWVPGGHSTVFTGVNAQTVAAAVRRFVMEQAG